MGLGCEQKSLYFTTWARENLLKVLKPVADTDRDLI